MSVNSCIYWHTLMDAMLFSALRIPKQLDCFWMRFPKGKWFFFSFPEESASKNKIKLLAECCIQTKQKIEKFTVHRCTWRGLNPEARAKESWLTVDCGCQGILVLRQGQAIPFSLGRESFELSSVSVRVGVWARMCCAQVIVLVPTVWTCAGRVKLITQQIFGAFVTFNLFRWIIISSTIL